MSEFKTIETQEELDAIIKERLSREKAKFSDYEQLKSRVKELETENGALKTSIEHTKTVLTEREGQISEFEKRIGEYETTNIRTRVALENGLPYELASRLVGTDEDSFKKDAQRLASMLKPVDVVAPLKTVEPEVNDPWRETLKGL